MARESEGEAVLLNAASTFDPQHNDIDAKVVLISSENVNFRVHA